MEGEDWTEGRCGLAAREACDELRAEAGVTEKKLVLLIRCIDGIL
jgi:hypothetical protein